MATPERRRPHALDPISTSRFASFRASRHETSGRGRGAVLDLKLAHDAVEVRADP
jgi:hypothetical protein